MLLRFLRCAWLPTPPGLRNEAVQALACARTQLVQPTAAPAVAGSCPECCMADKAASLTPAWTCAQVPAGSSEAAWREELQPQEQRPVLEGQVILQPDGSLGACCREALLLSSSPSGATLGA